MKEKIKTIKILHLALCVGLILIYYILGEFNSFEELMNPQLDTSNYLYLLIPVAAYLLSNFLFRMQLKKIDSSLNLEEKYPFYQSASLIRWAVLEGAAFIIVFVQKDLVIFGVLLILYLIFLRPTEYRMKTDLNENII